MTLARSRPSLGALAHPGPRQGETGRILKERTQSSKPGAARNVVAWEAEHKVY